MLGRYWLAVVALGLGLTWAYAKPITVAHPSGSSPNQRQPEVTQPAPPQVSPLLQSDIDRIAKALEAANRRAESAAENQRAQDNLDAQRKMADAARSTVNVAWFEAIITLVGVALVGWTLIHTKRAADAARNTLKSMIRIERPFIQARKFSITTPPRKVSGDALISVWGEAENCGSRLALVTGLSIGYSTTNLPLPPLTSSVQLNFTPHTVGPDETRTWPHPLCAIMVPEVRLKEIAGKNRGWFFYGFFLYRDAQQIQRRAGFAFEYWNHHPDVKTSELQVCGPAEYWYDIEDQSETSA